MIIVNYQWKCMMCNQLEVCQFSEDTYDFEITDTTEQDAESKNFLYLGGNLIASEDSDGNSEYYHTDILGSTRLTTDSLTGTVEMTQDYTPFGLKLRGTNDNDINIRANYSRQIGKSGYAISVYVVHKKVSPKIIDTLKGIKNICNAKT